MTFTQVRQYTTGLLKASFTNKSVLDKLTESNSGALLFDGTEIGTATEETITAQQMADAIAADVADINGTNDEEENPQEPQEPQEPTEEPGE